jgi:hypothetical protein
VATGPKPVPLVPSEKLIKQRKEYEQFWEDTKNIRAAHELRRLIEIKKKK